MSRTYAGWLLLSALSQADTANSLPLHKEELLFVESVAYMESEPLLKELQRLVAGVPV
jgi:hypothetical protein